MKPAYGRYLSFPFRIGTDGRTALVPGLNQHVRDEIIQLILTAIGERLFLPELGTNVRRLVFEGADEAVISLTRATIAQALSRWLGHRVHTDNLEVTFSSTPEGNVIHVLLQYRVAGGDANTISFQRRVGG